MNKFLMVISLSAVLPFSTFARDHRDATLRTPAKQEVKSCCSGNESCCKKDCCNEESKSCEKDGSSCCESGKSCESAKKN